jgi:hypothetical protein
MTSCDDPYIGDESIMRPPASKKARMTLVQLFRAATSSPTLNVIQLPRPTTGIASLLDGMRRVMIGPRACAALANGQSAAAALPARKWRNNWRRDRVTGVELSGFGIVQQPTKHQTRMFSLRSIRTVSALVTLASALVGCTSTPVGVEALAGRYELRSVNARTVPVDALGGAIGGELVLSDHGRVRRVVQYATSGIPGPITMRANGSYRVRGNEITLDLTEEPRGELLARPWRIRGEVRSARIVLRYSGPRGADTEEVYVRVP